MKKLVIDLGHGGTDPGAIGPNKTNESDVVLAIGKELNELLKGCNLEIKFTRLSDKYISLQERSKIANDFKADYFLSIHINSASDKTVRGVEIWQYSNKNDKLNKFANDLCNDISKIFNIRNRGLKLSKDLSVLRNTTMPSALIEVDFISNSQAEKDLNINSNIKAVAIAIKDNLVKLLDLQITNTNTLYRVCIGAYSDKNNALNQVKLAKDKGFKDAYIV
ncbi:MAG: N-acetylmuramoyl-L-alanine amidase [Clostridium sp.]